VLGVWGIMPVVTVLLLLLPQVMPRHAGAMAEILPPLALMAVFYWCVEHPGRLGYGWIFTAGLLQDILIAGPLGLNALLWVFSRYLIASSRKDIRDQGFIITWVYLSVLMLAVLAIQWVLMSASSSRVYALAPVFMQWCQAVLLYPAVHGALHGIERTFFRKYWYLLKPA